MFDIVLFSLVLEENFATDLSLLVIIPSPVDPEFWSKFVFSVQEAIADPLMKHFYWRADDSWRSTYCLVDPFPELFLFGSLDVRSARTWKDFWGVLVSNILIFL